MTDLITSLKQQIHSCETLMNIFQKERGILMQKSEVATSDVIPIIKLKKRLMTTFEQQHQLIHNLRKCQSNSENDDNQSKALLSQLGRKLEQLLVIDRENELLMKQVIKQDTTSTTSQKKVSYLNPQELPARVSTANRVYGGNSSRVAKKINQAKDVSIRSFNPQRLTVKKTH